VNQTFSYKQRLHDPKIFAKTLKNKAIVDKWLAIHCVQNSEGHDRLGIIVSKRLVSKASARNTIKRHIREAFRTGLSTNAVSCDIVVRLRKEVTLVETVVFVRIMSRLLKKVRMTDYDSPDSIVHQRLSVSN
jgi:ribonuclease P protein component